MRPHLVRLLLAAACSCAPRPTPPPDLASAPEPADERQILWQRDLDEALALAAAEGRPLLVAVNMDGESASERIVRERYRDPAFVALTRPFVCVVASVFRHAPRDFDERGLRIPCPRLGEVTCGEHAAIEPALHDRLLGGPRISPRHAVVLPGGGKAFDLYLAFDLRELDRRLAEEGAKVAARPNRRAAGGVDAVDELRVLLASGAVGGPDLALRAADLARDRGVESAMAAFARDRIGDPGPPSSAGEVPFPDAAFLRAFARLDGKSAASRSLLLALFVTRDRDDRSSAVPAVRELFGDEETARIEAGLDGRAPLLPALHAAQVASAAPASRRAELPDAESLARELREAEEALEQSPNDAARLARAGRASLALARRRMEAGERDAAFTLGRAKDLLARASDGAPRDASLLLDRARIAFHEGAHEDQERLALAALERVAPLPADAAGFLAGTSPAAGADSEAWTRAARETARALATPPERREALRWLGDAAARLLGSRSGGDPLVETLGIARCLRSLAWAAAAEGSDETDWVSLASAIGALGLRRDQILVTKTALHLLPDSTALHDLFGLAFRDAGRPDTGALEAGVVAYVRSRSGTCHWYHGHARIVEAEWLRRGERPDDAIRAYEEARNAFDRSKAARPDFADTADHYLAMAALGRGFAHLLADRRPEAADALVEALTMRPSIAGARDGLDREAMDLLDGALEERASGTSPVDSIALLERLAKALPGDPSWACRLADSELREALRADGRGEADAGDAYLARSLALARRAFAIGETEASRRTLAQSATIAAERLLARGAPAQAAPFLAEAAPLLGDEAPAAGAGEPVLRVLAGRLRRALGEARPVSRPGR